MDAAHAYLSNIDMRQKSLEAAVDQHPKVDDDRFILIWKRILELHRGCMGRASNSAKDDELIRSQICP